MAKAGTKKNRDRQDAERIISRLGAERARLLELLFEYDRLLGQANIERAELRAELVELRNLLIRGEDDGSYNAGVIEAALRVAA